MADSNTARRRRSDAAGDAPRGRALGAVRADAPPAAEESLTFNELKSLLRTTDGNLSVHARKLEDAQYVTVTKRFEDRRPRTEYRLTAAGRKALQRYLDHMEALIRATRDTLHR